MCGTAFPLSLADAPQAYGIAHITQALCRYCACPSIRECLLERRQVFAFLIYVLGVDCGVSEYIGVLNILLGSFDPGIVTVLHVAPMVGSTLKKANCPFHWRLSGMHKADVTTDWLVTGNVGTLVG